MSGLFNESISPETVGSILQAIADLLATATSETEYNIIRFLYDHQQRNVDDHCNVILQVQDEYHRLVKGLSKSPK